MNVRELRWWSTAGLVTLSTAVEPTWSRWCEAWGVGCSTVVAINACEACPPAQDMDRVELFRGLAAWLGARTMAPSEAVRDLLFGDTSSNHKHEGSMSSEIAALAWADLHARLVASLGDGTPGLDLAGPVPPSSDFLNWSGAVVLHLTSSRAGAPTIVLHLSGSCASRMGLAGMCVEPPPSSPPAQRCSVPEAMQEQRIALRVGLDDVLLDLATLGSLRCGDVLTLTHRLDQTLRVRLTTGDGDAVEPDLCAAVLGARGGQRAVEFVRAPAYVE